MFTFYAPHASKISPKQQNSASLTMEWFSSKALYPPREGVEVIPLINGQVAFGAVYEAIEKAKKSVEIISWGFDPSMRLKRPDGLRLGELLAAKGRSGVKVRVLIWKNVVANLVENTVVGDGLAGSGGTSAGSGVLDGSAISNETTQLDMRYRHNQATIARLEKTQKVSEQGHRAGQLPNSDPAMNEQIRNRIAQLKAENVKIDQKLSQSDLEGYGGLSGSGGTQRSPKDQIYARDWFRDIHGGEMKNVEFRTRDFTQSAEIVFDQGQIRLVRGRMDSLKSLLNAESIKDLTAVQMLALTQFASHHQKMVLVDYADTASATGFVMGHNMHHNYWDTDAHLFDDRAAGRDLGFGPWQDISMKVRGPVLGDLSHNFASAWDLESSWYTRWFKESLNAERAALPAPPVASRGANSVAQICRTQPQDGETSILEVYQKALGNVRDYVYMENQYFRYEDFAERLAALAAARNAKMAPNDLYLFVVTNTPNSSTASASTYETLKGLGHDQLMPQVQRDLAQEASRKRQRLDQLEAAPVHKDVYIRGANEREKANLRRRLEELRQQGVTPEVEKRLGEAKKEDIPELAQNTPDDKKPYKITEKPGLKVVIATLATSNPAPASPLPVRMSPEAEAALGAPPVAAKYRNIYVHSKLLLVDNIFSLLSSANINIRSMHSDSELGIAMPNPALTREMQQKLWTLHSRQHLPTTQENFKYWNRQLNKNWGRMKKGQPLVCHLVRFLDVVTPYSPMKTAD